MSYNLVRERWTYNKEGAWPIKYILSKTISSYITVTRKRFVKNALHGPNANIVP